MLVVQILFAFHSRNHHCMGSLQLLIVVLGGRLDPLDHKVFGNDLLDVRCMGFLGRYPTGIADGTKRPPCHSVPQSTWTPFRWWFVFEHLFEAKLVGEIVDLAMSEELFGGEDR